MRFLGETQRKAIAEWERMAGPLTEKQVTEGLTRAWSALGVVVPQFPARIAGQDFRVLVLGVFCGSVFRCSSISLTVRSGPPASAISTRFGSMARKARKLRAP